MQVADEAADDFLAESATLVYRVNRDVDDLEGQPTIADELALNTYDDGKVGVWQADRRTLNALSAQARKDAETAVFVRTRRFAKQIILFVKHLTSVEAGMSSRKHQAGCDAQSVSRASRMIERRFEHLYTERHKE